MHILVLGGYGFIGTALCRALHGAGHKVTGLGRDTARAERRMPYARWIAADLRRLQTPESWTPLLDGVDAVVNAAGALQDGGRDDLGAVQDRAMRALWQAAAAQARKPVIVQISADTLGPGADTAFMATKRAADDALKASGLAHVILRPALVIGRNAHGGSALLRALAAFPAVTSLAHGDAPVRTVALDDVAAATLAAVEGRIPPGSDLALAHDEAHSLRDVVAAHRAWLGLKPARTVPVPRWLAALTTLAADAAGRFGWRAPLRSTALAVMAGAEAAATRTPEMGRTADSEHEAVESTREPAESRSEDFDLKPLKSLQQILHDNPAGAQDLWFARLYLLKPVLIAGLAAFWIASGLIAFARIDASVGLLERTGMGGGLAAIVALATGLADIAIGAAVLWRRLAATALRAMIALSALYLLVASVLAPVLWLDPLGPLVKIVPAMLAAAAALAVLDER